MTKYILDTTIISPTSNNKAQQIIVLCHGYGGDGKDISLLAINWRRFLPDAIFLCPNAPEICPVNPQGYQWFDLSSEKEDVILEKSLLAEEKLSKYLDQVIQDFQLEFSNLALVGFSQGCMMSLQVALKKKEKINCVIGYSGKIINKKNLSESINSKPKIFPMYMLEAKEYFGVHGIKLKTKLFNNCEHKIPVEGTSLGLDFLKKNLL